MYLQTKGFILRQRNWREYDKLITIYTDKAGKLDIQARGIRKIQSKLRGHLQPFALVDFHLARGKMRYQLIGAELLENFEFSTNNFQNQIGYAYYMLELVNKLTRDNQRQDEVFGLLQNGLNSIERENIEEDLKKIRIAFLLKILKATGFNPEKRVEREQGIQEMLEKFLKTDLNGIKNISINGEMKSLFNISQYTLNEVIDEPMQTVKFLQAL